MRPVRIKDFTVRGCENDAVRVAFPSGKATLHGYLARVRKTCASPGEEQGEAVACSETDGAHAEFRSDQLRATISQAAFASGASSESVRCAERRKPAAIAASSRWRKASQ
jgi:hypothetical protein